MEKTMLSTPDAPAAIGPYAQGWAVGPWVYTSGQIGADPRSGELPAGITAQAEQSCRNVAAVLAAAGATSWGVADFAAFNAVYAQHFPACPARSCVAVRELPKGALCEIEAVAVRA